MTPREFVESLLRHYAKRHASEAAELAWHREQAEIVGSPPPEVLRKAYVLIRDEHEERAFPLPATIKKAIARAWAAQPKGSPKPEPEWVPPTPEQKRRAADAFALIQRTIAANALPETKRAAPVAASRPAFAAMQSDSPNPHLHKTRHGLSDLSRRITGEHREDAA